MIDQFYTPGIMATNIFAGLQKSGRVADFAIGDGSLIKNLPYTPDMVFGLDLNPSAVVNLGKNYPKWKLKNGDFLTPDEETTRWLVNLKGKLDLIVLNPPFSCKGKKRISVDINEKSFVCRIAMAFLAKAFEYLDSQGQLIAILPLSSVKSEADTKVLNELARNWDITFGEKFGPSTFSGCSPSSTVIHFTPKILNDHRTNIRPLQPRYKGEIEIVRGTVTMPETKTTGLYDVLHTVNLQNGKIGGDFKRINRRQKHVSGNYLCIPRVCKPVKDKLVLVKNRSFVLSDCVFALRIKGNYSGNAIKELLLDQWDDFAGLYDSTCAPYVTISQLTSFFLSHGFITSVCNGFQKNELSNIQKKHLVVDYAVSL